MQTVKQTSPQGVEIEMIEAPAAMRPDFATVSASGLIVKSVPVEELTAEEKESFHVQKGKMLWDRITRNKTNTGLDSVTQGKDAKMAFNHYLRRRPGGAA